MSSSPIRTRGAALVAATAALAVLLTGCGGTRVSDEAIEQAAGVGAGAPVAPATGGTAAAPDTAGTADAPAANIPGSVAAAPNAGAGAAVATPAAGTGGKATPGNAAGTATKPNAQTSATGAKPAAGGAPAATTPAGPATKSPIRVGVVGTFSGPVGGLVKDTVTGIRVWGQYINARGGVNGHPVEILVGDDGGDPARFNSIEQQFVEQKGAIAFIYATLGFSPNGNNKYLDSKKIFTFGTEGGLETVYNNPYVLSATPSGLTNADSILLALGDVARPLGKKKFASFACSDFGLCDNFDNRWSNAAALKEVGFELVARGRPSLTQPDYTSQCLAAKQGGAEVVMMALDTASLRRFAGDCARQNYKPIFGTADLLALSSLPSDPNVDGLIVASKMAPWTDPSVPGIAEVTKAFAQYAPGPLPTGGNTNGWILGQFFASAGASLPDNPTAADVETGLYKIKNDNLDGMTYPITMTKGKPMPRQLCYGVVVIKDKKYSRYPGKALRCRSDALPGSVVPSSVTDDQVQASPVRRALTASAPARVPSARVSPAIGISAAEAWLVRSTPSSYPAPTRSARPADDAACAPARAAGFSYLLDAFETGLSAGPGVVYGASLAVFGTPLPEPFGAYQGQALKQSGTVVEQFSDQAPQAVTNSRAQFEPFAVYNDYGNAFIDAGADALDQVATAFGPFIQPGDTSLHEFAGSMRAAKAANVPCQVVVGNAGNAVVTALASALANGQSRKAMALIAKHNLAADAGTLGEAVFYGGIATANANTFEAFSKAVAESFVDGGVSPVTTGQAFQAAATKAFGEGLTFEQGAIGFRTIVETYQRYFTENKLF